MLDKQIDILSVDTGHFYSKRESHLHWKNHQLRAEKRYLKNKIELIKAEIKKISDLTDNQILEGVKVFYEDEGCDVPEYLNDIDVVVKDYMYDIYVIKGYIKDKNNKINESKRLLLQLLENKVEQNIKTGGKDHIRQLDGEHFTDDNYISVFESSLTRMIGVKTNEFTDAFMVVQVYYFDVARDLILHGFEYNGEKYIYFTSSAGQIRTKKCVFIKESIWKQYEKTIMCGLTLDSINAKGGNNPNKHLAYMALANSATDLWEEFNIDKTIVIDDFETEVFGEYDLIDDLDYSVTRTKGNVPIPHTDGAGMMLPSAFGKKQKNVMVRLPFIKGLLGVFDFKRFIQENNCSGEITDIYGNVHNVIEEDIQVIFTKSQMKMAKYYESYEQYKEYFKMYGCTAGITNPEEDRIKNATINYQMLQSLTDITDDEIDKICKTSRDKIENICSSLDTIKSIMGITPYNLHKTPLQEAIEIYPPIIQDEFIKANIREVKDSKIKRFKYGKLDIRGKYTFLLPDFYAACEYWFMGIGEPQGLLQDGEVFCWLFRNDKELDCLRSPHLYREHPVRYNKAYDDNQELKQKLYAIQNQCNTKLLREQKAEYEQELKYRKWFTTDAVYTSTHDLISKILQFDCDGDKSLVVADQNFIEIAKRNMQGIVPLYYNMRKAEPRILNSQSIYDGLNAAFSSSGIGLYSNNISKIWNSDVFVNGTTEEQDEAIKVIRLLCMENNFCIDEAKTLYMPERPEWFKPMVSKFTQNDVPYFFKYAKDKEEHQVARINDSFVNKLSKRVKNVRLNFRNIVDDDFDYRNLMSNPDLVIENIEEHPIIQKYLELLKTKDFTKYMFQMAQRCRRVINIKDILYLPKPRLDFIINNMKENIINELTEGYDIPYVVDVLVIYLCAKRNSKNKAILWYCFGDQIIINLKQNVGKKYLLTKEIQCIDCGEWFMIPTKNNNVCRCPQCQIEKKRFDGYNRVKKYRNTLL